MKVLNTFQNNLGLALGIASTFAHNTVKKKTTAKKNVEPAPLMTQPTRALPFSLRVKYLSFDRVK